MTLELDSLNSMILMGHFQISILCNSVNFELLQEHRLIPIVVAENSEPDKALHCKVTEKCEGKNVQMGVRIFT